MRDVLQGKSAPLAYLGAAIKTLTPDLAEAYGLPGPWGSIIASVSDGSPAAQAKLRVGDIILSLNGEDRQIAAPCCAASSNPPWDRR